MLSYALSFIVSCSDVDEADDDADESDIDDNYKRHNAGDDDIEDGDEEERDTFDLGCDNNEADEFFSSAAFMNAVELLGGEVEQPRPPPPSNQRAVHDDVTDDPPPEKPDVSEMEADEAAAAIKAWCVARKRWTDRRSRQRRNQRNGNGDLLVYSGDSTPMLRMMTEVTQRRLLPGHSFEDKDILRMRIAEEANLSNKEINTVRSDKMQLVVVGVDFYVKANNTERRGWVVSKAICREGDGTILVNAASRKIKCLGRADSPNNQDCIDLANSSDEEDEGKLWV